MKSSNDQEKKFLLETQINKLRLELDGLEQKTVLKKVKVETLSNGYLLGIKTDVNTPYDERTELFLTEEEGKELVKDLLLGCDDGLFILSPFSRDLSDILKEIGKAFG